MSTFVVLMAIAWCEAFGRGDWKCVESRVGADRIKRGICDEYCHLKHGDELQQCYRRIDELRGG